MKTKELVYIVTDLVKILSDDSDIQEEHILFLLDKYRGLLLQQYHNIKKEIPTSLYLTICLDLERFDNNIAGYLKATVRSIKEVPDIMTIGTTSVYPHNEFYVGENIVLTSRERMKFVGHNKWMKNFIYCSIAPDKHLYFTANECQLDYLDKVKVTAIFEDVKKAMELACTQDNCPVDIMEQEFPIEVSLVPTLAAYAIRDILGAAYRPKDVYNSSADELSDLESFVRKNMKSLVAKLIEGDQQL